MLHSRRARSLFCALALVGGLAVLAPTISRAEPPAAAAQV